MNCVLDECFGSMNALIEHLKCSISRFIYQKLSSRTQREGA